MTKLTRIKRILTLIETIWLAMPDLRLCQLIGNCFEAGDLYNISDEELEHRLTETYDFILEKKR